MSWQGAYTSASDLQTFSLEELLAMRERFIHGERVTWNIDDMDSVIREKRALRGRSCLPHPDDASPCCGAPVAFYDDVLCCKKCKEEV